MGRAVWLPWGAESLQCNLYTMLVGKPGDRKTSTINLADAIAKKCLAPEAFLPKNFSPETLVDEYDIETGGRPDKIWLCDDANPVLADWQGSVTGGRNAARFLELYDCKALSESYRRNRKEQESGEQRRSIPHTSTSIVFGGTFNICTSRNQITRAGLQRRFLYYVAEKHGRLILYPKQNNDEFCALVEVFSLLGKLGGPFSLSPKARQLFEKYQMDNRVRMDRSDPLDEALLSRLSSSPSQSLKIAQIFEACRSVRSGSISREIQEATLHYAIDHVDECLQATTRLDSITRRIHIANDAEVLLAKIRCDFSASTRNAAIILSRTELTSKYANHGRRNYGLNVQDLYLRLIPYLIAQGEAKVLPKEGKLERYAFRADGT
jgi:Protein of unknown function (DUF3987)